MSPAVVSPAIHPLVEQMVTRHGATRVTIAEAAQFIARPGRFLLVFTEDPRRYRETLDLAVIVPELARTFPGRFAIGVLYPEDARNLASRFGFRRWPALVMLADGAYVGAIDGLRNWDEYLQEIERLLVAPPSRPPGVGIAVTATVSNTARETLDAGTGEVQ